jgi:hypothetical protein
MLPSSLLLYIVRREIMGVTAWVWDFEGARYSLAPSLFPIAMLDMQLIVGDLSCDVPFSR